VFGRKGPKSYKDDSNGYRETFGHFSGGAGDPRRAEYGVLGVIDLSDSLDSFDPNAEGAFEICG
jgi:hypothetical protein